MIRREGKHCIRRRVDSVWISRRFKNRWCAIPIRIKRESRADTAVWLMWHRGTPVILVTAHILLHHDHLSHCGWMIVAYLSLHCALLLPSIPRTRCLFTPLVCARRVYWLEASDLVSVSIGPSDSRALLIGQYHASVGCISDIGFLISSGGFTKEFFCQRLGAQVSFSQNTQFDPNLFRLVSV